MSLPVSLRENPRLDGWVRFDEGGTVRISTGKVELGQGILTALAQIAAEELDLRFEQVRMMSGNSVEGPAEGYTASSWSVEHSGGAIRQACAEVRAMALARAALRLNCAAEELSVEEGAFLRAGEPTGLDYWAVAPDLDLSIEATGTAAPKPPATYRIVGTSIARGDLPAKLTGSGFIHDISAEGMLHARVLRQPGRGARLVSFDEERLRRREPGVFLVVQVANFLAFVGPDEAVVQRAAEAGPACAIWEGARRLASEQATADWLAAQAPDNRLIGDPYHGGAQDRVTAVFSRPFLSHGSPAPSCGLAEYRDGRLTVWSHGQGMHPLRANIARTLGLPVERVACFHAQGGGAYGHNGADDAAMDAALVAMQMPERLIRVMWRREEEFGYEPLSSAMKVAVHAVLDDSGRPTDWTTEIWSAAHGQRPGVGGAYLLAADALAELPPARKPFDIPEDRGGGATRNGLPLYDIAAKRIDFHLIHDIPVRTSSLRGLGATLNVFAIEGLMDELAGRAGADPLDYRLSLLGEPRARAVLERAAEVSGWRRRGEAGTGRGLGLGIARYKNSSAWAAVVARVAVDEAVRVEQVWCAVDAGLVVNPDGLRNQIEGNIVQAVSWALIEEVRFEEGTLGASGWRGYPVIRFSQVPEISVELIEAAHQPPLGVGECAGGPAAAAIGNAVAHALGVRIRDMPMNRDRIMAAMLA